MVGFTSRPNESVSLAVARPCRGVAMYVIGTEAPTVLDAVKVDGQMELHLPAFSYYAGLEFRWGTLERPGRGIGLRRSHAQQHR